MRTLTITGLSLCIAITTVACGDLADDPTQQGLSGKGDNGQVPLDCIADTDCTTDEFCKLDEGQCMLPTMNIIKGTCSARPQYCTYEYAPVCGCDNKTYSNACMAASAGVSVASDGECNQNKGTCTSDNDCAADAFCKLGEGQCLLPTMNILEGTCTTKSEYCTYEYAPVCGCDNKTYSNACMADGAGVSVAFVGACQPTPQGCVDNANCAEGEFCKFDTGLCLLPTMNIITGTCTAKLEYCTYEYAPVCGCDNKTYSNACFAASAGVSVAFDSACN